MKIYIKQFPQAPSLHNLAKEEIRLVGSGVVPTVVYTTDKRQLQEEIWNDYKQSSFLRFWLQADEEVDMIY